MRAHFIAWKPWRLRRAAQPQRLVHTVTSLLSAPRLLLHSLSCSFNFILHLGKPKKRDGNKGRWVETRGKDPGDRYQSQQRLTEKVPSMLVPCSLVVSHINLFKCWKDMSRDMFGCHLLQGLDGSQILSLMAHYPPARESAMFDWFLEKMP